jgi:monofunctional biosynthetic peptidoglycan transglycosylase
MTFAMQRRRKRGTLFRLMRALLVVLIVALVLPYLLVPVYRVVNPVSTPMLWRWLTGARVERSYVPIERMAAALPLAVLTAEDARFCIHSGIDWQQIMDAIDEADDLSEARGASTITQQTAKNLFLWSGRSFVRKGLEAPLALWMELMLPKRRILEIYLNVAEWGPDGRFGAEAAARWAFGKAARDLTAREAALLAAVLPNPVIRSARQPGPAVRRLAAVYETRTARAGSIAACIRSARNP